MQSEAVKDMPETIELGYFYIGAPMSEYFYSVMDDETRLQGMQPLRKAVYVRQEAAKSPASAVEVVTVDDAINAMILNLSRPAEGEHDPFLAAKTSFAIKAVEAIERSGWRIVKSPEGV